MKQLSGKLTWFNDVFAAWLVEQSGPMPTQAQLMVPINLGKRPGVEALYIAMCLRTKGCTVRQFQIAGNCGPANNYRGALVKTGLMQVSVEGKPYAHKLVLTPKGEAAVAKGKLADKKDVAARKPRKVKVEAPVVVEEVAELVA